MEKIFSGSKIVGKLPPEGEQFFVKDFEIYFEINRTFAVELIINQKKSTS